MAKGKRIPIYRSHAFMRIPEGTEVESIWNVSLGSVDTSADAGEICGLH